MESRLAELPRPIYDANPEWIELYDLAWQIAADNIETPGNPAWLPQMTCMPGSGKIWQWDSCFMPFFTRYSNATISALNNLDNLYRLQDSNGYISMAYDWKTDREAYGKRINPPIYAWVELEHYKFTGDEERLQRVFPILKKYFTWLRANRRRENGLYYFEDTGSSGMDNSPRSGYYAAGLAGSDVCFVDLSCQQLLSAKTLSEMAERMEMDDDATYFRHEANDLKRLINHYCWSSRSGFYHDCFARSNTSDRHNFLSCKTVAAFWAVLSGAADNEQLDSLINHLLNPDEFWTLHPVPSLSRMDPNYNPCGAYWCGGVWAPINYMIVQGLTARGHEHLAREVVVKHLNAMHEVAQNAAYGGIWEAYAPEYFRPSTSGNGDSWVHDNFVGWSGLGPIAMLIENIIGLSFDALSNTVSWNIADPCRQGLQHVRFNGTNLSLIGEGKRDDGNNKFHIQVECDKGINLEVAIHNAPWRRASRSLDVGRHEFSV